MQGGAATSTKNIYANGVLISTITDTAGLVQQATSTASAGTILGTTLASSPRAGDTLMLTLGSLPSTSTITSITGGGVTWQKAAQSGINRDAEIWYGLNSNGSGTQVSTTLSTACQGTCMINISEWSGVATSSALNSTSTRNSSGTIIFSPTSTTSNAKDLIIATERGDNSSTLLTGPTGAFAGLASAVPTVGNSAYDLINTTTTTSTSWTFASSANYDSVIAAFKMISNPAPGTSVTNDVLTDNLGGTNVVTNASGTTIVETLDYYPYGGIRIDNQVGGINESRKFIGEPYDSQTQLSYLNARYYNSAQGQFISEDPTFLGNPSNQDLQNPQSLNSYSYANDNPISNEDPSGKISLAQISSELSQISATLKSISNSLAQIGSSAGSTISSAAGSAAHQVGQAAESHPYITGAATVVGVGAAAYFAAPVVAGYIGIDTLVEGGAGAAALCEKYCPEEDEAIPLNGPINIGEDALQHVVNGHTIDGVEAAGNSTFNEGENLVDLIKSGTQQPVEAQSWGNNLQRVFDVGRNIGTYNVTGEQTTIMTIITDPQGNLVTSFPGFPSR